jgi:hypothetical protein
VDNPLRPWCGPKRVQSICGDGGDGVMKSVVCAGCIGMIGGRLRGPRGGLRGQGGQA